MEKEQIVERDLEKVSGGVSHEDYSRCPACGSVAYTLIMVETGGWEHRRCTSCKTEYWHKIY